MTWPQSSGSACWYCCHTFETVPCFCPISYDEFYGNFCSWNCVKAHILLHKRKASSYVAIIAFLTAHRPRYCRSVSYRHNTDCPCVSEFQGIPLPLPKEELQLFGGKLTIQEYRQGFYTIEDINWVHLYYLQRKTYDGALPHFRFKQERKTVAKEQSRPFVLVKKPKMGKLF